MASLRITTALLLSLVLIGISCKPDTASPATTPGASATAGKHHLPAMTKAQYMELRERCTAVDYIFHTMPFSVNQTDKASVLSNLGMISSEQADALDPSCKPFAREIFQAGGEIFLEADLYYGAECNAYVFFKGKEAVYANKIDKTGMDFYNKLINQVKVQSGQQ